MKNESRSEVGKKPSDMHRCREEEVEMSSRVCQFVYYNGGNVDETDVQVYRNSFVYVLKCSCALLHSCRI